MSENLTKYKETAERESCLAGAQAALSGWTKDKKCQCSIITTSKGDKGTMASGGEARVIS